MKSKNIFKTLALAMLMPAMLLSTSCNKEVSTENPAEKGYEFPVTINVTRQSDDPGTRATFNESTRKLEFTAGDKLFVSGNNATAGQYAGTLDYDAVSGKFSGIITTKNEYTGTIEALLTGSYAILLPKDYGSYGFFSYTENNGYDAALFLDYSNAFSLTKAAAVEQFSLEYGTYSSGFALNPMCAVLNFTINGLAASTEVAVVFNDGSTNTSGNVTTNASGIATFAIGVVNGTDLNGCSLTVGGNAITLVSSSKTVEAGKIYNITRSAVTLDYVEFSDGVNNVKVAPMNLGATTVAESAATCYGDFYAWGATEPFGTVAYTAHNSGTVTATAGHTGAYTIANAPYYSSGYTKYNTTDGKTALEAADDAVAVNKSGWHMPTQAELQTLYAACGGTGASITPSSISSGSSYSKGIYWVEGATSTVTVGGDAYKVNGMLFVQDADTHVFFPAAGSIQNDELSNAGTKGSYWSATRDEAPWISYAIGLFPSSTELKNLSTSAGRNTGLSVRPFKD